MGKEKEISTDSTKPGVEKTAEKELTVEEQQLAKIAKYEAEIAEAKSIIKELQDQLDAKTNQANTGKHSFVSGGKKYEMGIPRFKMSFAHQEGDVKLEKGSIIKGTDLEKLPKLVSILLTKKLGGLVELK